MPLESATYINQLVPANPLSTDHGSQGDDHIRLIKNALKATFPNVTGPVNVSQSILNYPVPIGMIMAWYGDIASIPAGYARCDGQTYTRTDGGGAIVTPNLRGRTIFGTSTAVDSPFFEHTFGGAQTKTSAVGGAHDHTIAVGAGGTHSHTVTVNSAGGHSHTITTDSEPNHTHTGTTNAGGNHDHSVASAGSHDHTGNTGSYTLQVADIPAHSHLVVHTEDNALFELPTPGRAIAHARSYSPGDGQNYTLGRAETTAPANVGKSSEVGGGTSHRHVIASDGSHSHLTGNSGTHEHGFTTGADGGHMHNGTTNSTGSHTHTTDMNNAGSHTHIASASSQAGHTHTVDVLPPYYSLVWIMKI